MSLLSPPRISAILLFVHVFVSVTAHTTPQHVIGLYVLSEFASLLADSSDCFQNMTVSRFQFLTSSAPSNVVVPPFFNMDIKHRATKLNDRSCQSFNSILAVQSTHPYIQNRSAVLDAWAAAGGMSPRVQWATESFLKNVEKEEWVVGYDPTERSCSGLLLGSGVAYLWYQPGWDYLLGGGFQVRGGVNYLFMIFDGSVKKGCVYEGVRIQGTGGPVSDPTNPNDGVPINVQEPQEENGEEGGTSDLSPIESPTPASESEGQEAEEEPEDLPDSFGTATGGGDPEPECFPGSARVYMEDGSSRNMWELKIGGRVRVGGGEHSDVCFFSHREREGSFKFVKLGTEGGKVITISDGHYLYSGRGLVAAGSVRVGDEVQVVEGGTEKVVEVASIEATGRFAPHTLIGDLVVDGVLVSSYTTAVHPVLAHYVLLRPVRWLYRLGLREVLHGWLDKGNDRLRRALPGGPRFSGWLV